MFKINNLYKLAKLLITTACIMIFLFLYVSCGEKPDTAEEKSSGNTKEKAPNTDVISGYRLDYDDDQPSDGEAGDKEQPTDLLFDRDVILFDPKNPSVMITIPSEQLGYPETKQKTK